MRLPPIDCHIYESKQGFPIDVNEDHERRPCEILPHLLIGQTGDPCLDDVDYLEQMGVVYLINCGEANHIERIRRTYHSGKLKAIDLNLEDSSKQDLSLALDFILPLIYRAKLKKRKCLVYCRNCMSRAVSVTVAYLIKYEQMTLLEAMSLVKSFRREASPNPGFMKQLIKFEVQHQSNFATSHDQPLLVPTVDIDLYRMDRFGKPHEYAIEQKRGLAVPPKNETEIGCYKRNFTSSMEESVVATIP